MSFVVLDDACQLLFLMIRSSFLTLLLLYISPPGSFLRSSLLSDVGAALQQQHQQANSAKDATTKSLMADQRNDSLALNLQTATTASTATRDKSELTPSLPSLFH